jgi:tetratricopeptide (TPR) repeat protein
MVAVVVGLAVAHLPVRAEEEKKDTKNALREELLKLNAVTGEEAQLDKLRALLKDKQKAKQLVTEAGQMLKESKGKESPFNFNGASIVARLAHINKQYDIAEPFYEYMIETATKLNSGSKLVTAYVGLVSLYFDSKKYALAAETCEKFMDLTGPEEVEREQPFMLERLAKAKAKEEKFDEALRWADLLIDGSRDGAWYFLQTKGWILREQGKLPAAIDAYLESLEKLEANKVLKPDLKERLKDAKHLQILIKRNPDNPTYKNDLGFIWCDNDMNLEESEKLIREALELDKKEKEKLKAEGKIDEVRLNAAYLDSLGWVLFKQKKYKEALEPLKQAAADEDDGNHMEIWDHLADCYMALGMKKEAIATWEQALKFEDLSKRDAERRRKISEKLKKARTE